MARNVIAEKNFVQILVFIFGPGQVIHSVFVMSASNECLLKLKKCLGPSINVLSYWGETNKVTLSRQIQMYFYKANVRLLVYFLICSLLCLTFFVYSVHSSENLQIYMETPSICFVTIPYLPNANSNKQEVGSLQVYFNWSISKKARNIYHIRIRNKLVFEAIVILNHIRKVLVNCHVG